MLSEAFVVLCAVRYFIANANMITMELILVYDKPCDESDILSPEIEVQLKFVLDLRISQQQDGSINLFVRTKTTSR